MKNHYGKFKAHYKTKAPKLIEAVYYILGYVFEGNHKVMEDTIKTFELFYKLIIDDDHKIKNINNPLMTFGEYYNKPISRLENNPEYI